jgi:hypothetical protein
MDADDVMMIINNIRDPYERAYEICLAVLRKRDALDPKEVYSEEPFIGNLTLCTELGEAIRDDLIKVAARREHRMDVDRQDTLTVSLFSQMLDCVSWTDVGERYLVSTRERYGYDRERANG